MNPLLRRRAPRVVGAAMAALLGVGLLASSPTASVQAAPVPLEQTTVPALDNRPNIVVVLTDDMRVDELKHLPSVQQLLRSRGTTFTHALSPHPLCCPARAEIVSGQYAQNNGVRHNNGPWGGFKSLNNPLKAAAVALEDSGYLTAWHGKYLNAYAAADGRQPGWSIWDPLVGNVSAYTRFTFANGDVFSDDYIAGRITERALTSLDRFDRADQPFYLFTNQTAPHDTMFYKTESGEGDLGNDDTHTPPTPEPKYRGLFKNQDAPGKNRASFNRPGPFKDAPEAKPRRTEEYHQMARMRLRALQSVDDSVERLVAKLKADGEFGNTYFIFTSDNGYMLGEHGMMTKNVLAREALRIPMVITGPGVKQGTDDHIVTLLDMTATMLDIANVAPLQPLDGVSLLPFLERRGQQWRNTTLVQTGDTSADGFDRRGVYTERYMYTKGPKDGDAMLFDHSVDPYETRNVAHSPRYIKVRRELERRTEVLGACSGQADCNRVFSPLPAARR